MDLPLRLDDAAAHNSTGPTSVSLLSELEKVLRLGRSTSEQREPRRRAMLDGLGNPAAAIISPVIS